MDENMNINQEQTSQDIAQPRFGPQTGQPIVSEPQPRFDPQTGQPIVSEPQPRFDPQTGQPTQYENISNTVKKNKKNTIIGLVAVLAVVAVVAGIALFVMGSSPYNQIKRAFANTFKSDAFVSDMQKVLSQANTSKGRVQIDATLSLSGEDVKATMASGIDTSKKQQELSVSVHSDVGSYYISEYMTSDSVYIDSSFQNRAVKYDFTKGPDEGSLLYGSDSEKIDDLLKAFKSLLFDSNIDALQKEIVKIADRHFSNLTYEKLQEREYRIDEKYVECTGYATIIDAETLIALVRDIEEAQRKRQSSFMNTLVELGYDADYSLADQLSEELGDSSTGIKLTFYIYNNQFASIEILAPYYNVANPYTDGGAYGEKVDILFHGGTTYPWHNMEIEFDGSSLALEGDIDGDSTTLILSADDYEVCSLEYDSKEKNLEFDVMGLVGFTGGIEHGSSSGTITIDGTMWGEIDFSYALTMSSKSGINMPDKDVLELNSANEDDLSRIVNESEMQEMERVIEDALMWMY